MPRKSIPRNIAKARSLRTEMSLPEVLLWQLLRKQPDGVKFRRQHPVGDFVLDFYCAEAKVCIEVDGIAHNLGDNPLRDEQRDGWLNEQGIEVLRIPATDVLRSPQESAEALVRYCKGR